MKYQPTTAEIAATRAYITRKRSPAETTQAAMQLGGWSNPQIVNLDNELYVAASTTGCTIFVKGAPGAYEIALCGADPLLSADIQIGHVPSPECIYEIWRLLSKKG